MEGILAHSGIVVYAIAATETKTETVNRIVHRTIKVQNAADGTWHDINRTSHEGVHNAIWAEVTQIVGEYYDPKTTAKKVLEEEERAKNAPAGEGGVVGYQSETSFYNTPTNPEDMSGSHPASTGAADPTNTAETSETETAGLDQ